MSIHVFGIRHHGPGSARALAGALADLKPDAILVEGPPDAAEVLPLLAHAEMRPPVALLIYQPDQPARAAFYPFAVFSPEWQAIHYGLSNSIPVRFMDLPQAHMMALDAQDAAEAELAAKAAAEPAQSEAGAVIEAKPPDQSPMEEDPLRWLAQAAGFEDGEVWWERMVEQRRADADLFAGILEAMAALREHFPTGEGSPHNRHEPQREAWMRQTIRAAQKEGFERVAVICGAWHSPVLAGMPVTAKEDAALLKGLPKVKVSATWVPWTYTRLSRFSGYGAGITSPGWYEHLWNYPDQTAIRWSTTAAQLLRGEDLVASTAQVIDTVRLAEALAAIRGYSSAGLPELQESIKATLAGGQSAPMALVQRKLIVGEVLGAVPHETPTVPLQKDLQAEQKRLRLPPEEGERDLDLDLRKPNDLDRSYLLHRLSLLDIPWGAPGHTGQAKGTFHEVWKLRWQPEYAVAVIEASIWGNTVRDAASAAARDAADQSTELPPLTELAGKILLAELPEAVEHVMGRLQEVAALASDVTHLMAAAPPLANIMRYSNVRRTDSAMVGHILNGLVARICVGLPGACGSLADEAAEVMLKHLLAVDGAINLLNNPDHVRPWRAMLAKLCDQAGLHGLIAGRCCRLLMDAGHFEPAEAARRMGLALSTAAEPAQAGAWLDGFLRDSGTILLLDEALFSVIDAWVVGLSGDAFQSILPLLRRTFSTFSVSERRQLGERVRRGAATVTAAAHTSADFDPARADAAMPLVGRLLGLAEKK